MLIEEPSFGWAERTHKIVSEKQESEVISEVRHKDDILTQTTSSLIKLVKRQEHIEMETRTISS